MTPRDTGSPPRRAGARLDHRQSMWRLSPREISFGLVCAVITVWIALIVVVPLRQPVLGGDFMQFYAFAAAARRADWLIQYDWPAFHELQTALVPSSADYRYPPSYPPLVPALYLPLAWLSFPAAYAAWTLVAMAIYCALMGMAAAGCPAIRRWHVVLAGLLFPPFIAHAAAGQSTIWPLIGFVSGWWALSRSAPVTAGLLFSIVAIKPHLGMAMAIVLIGARLWSVVGGVIAGLAVQAGLTAMVCGPLAIAAYAETTVRVLRDTTLIDPSDDRFTHGLRMELDGVLPHDVATIAWLLASAVFGWMAVRAWRRHDAWTLRIAALLLATLLISPHVQTYDGVLLAPAVLWLSCWAVRTRQGAVLVATLALSVVFVTPAARLWGAPVTLPLMAWLLWRCQRRLALEG